MPIGIVPQVGISVEGISSFLHSSGSEEERCSIQEEVTSGTFQQQARYPHFSIAAGPEEYCIITSNLSAAVVAAPIKKMRFCPFQYAPSHQGHCKDTRRRNSLAAFITSALATVWIVGSAALAQGVPLPPKRPSDLTLPTPSKGALPGNNAQNTNAPAVQTLPVVSDCTERLAAVGMMTEKAVVPKGDNEACSVDDPIRLLSMRSQDRTVAFPDRPLLACRAAHAVGIWVRDIVLSISEGKMRSTVVAVNTGPGFECRNRNRASTGKLSAHANGLAIDVAKLNFADKSVLVVAKPEGEAQRQFLDTLRKSGCGWFTTVLGPGSDAAHADHLHLDVELRGASGTGRYCQ